MNEEKAAEGKLEVTLLDEGFEGRVERALLYLAGTIAGVAHAQGTHVGDIGKHVLEILYGAPEAETLPPPAAPAEEATLPEVSAAGAERLSAVSE